MLKGLDPLLTPELLKVLRAMGHGDELAIVDANFPATSTARQLIRVDGANLVAMGRAVLTVLPLDTYVDNALYRMEVIDDPQTLPTVQEEFLAEVRAAEGDIHRVQGLDRFAFYERTRQSYAVVQTGDQRAFANFILKKGVILHH